MIVTLVFCSHFDLISTFGVIGNWHNIHAGSPGGAVLQNKASMIFNELCLIHANTTSDERNCRTSHDIDLDDESRSEYGCVFISCHGSAEMLHLSFAFLCMLLVLCLYWAFFSVVIILFKQRSNYLFIFLGSALNRKEL